jgi:hypothetical protein
MRSARILLFAGLVALWPGVAQAQWDWYEWLQELSGPGPFDGKRGIDLRLLCFADIEPQRGVRPIWTPSCLPTPLQAAQFRHVSIDFGLVLLKAERNPLTYAAGKDPAVDLRIIKSTIWWRPFYGLEVGAGGGTLRFKGPAFDSFTRFFVEPFRVDLKPSGLGYFIRQLRDYQVLLEAVSFRWGIMVVPDEFVAEDFGAIPGSYRSTRRVLRSRAISVEVDPVIRYFRRAR